jgi:hypothetical protein
MNHFSWSFAAAGGEFRYSYEIDNRNLRIIQVGETLHSYGILSTEQPAGWLRGVNAWISSRRAMPGRSTDAMFAVTTSWRPGLVPVVLRGQESIGDGLLVNAVLRYAIGPAFAPDVDKEGVMDLARKWAYHYGFAFLQPFLDGKPLADLSPESGLEEQIVECLRAALQ